MTIYRDQSGFSAVEAILVLVIVGIIGFAGWFVWHSQKATDKTLSDTNKSQSAAPIKQRGTSKQLAVKEWGVKLAPIDTEKLTYVYYAYPQGQRDGQFGELDSNISLYVRSGILKNDTCRELAIVHTRYVSLNDMGKQEFSRTDGPKSITKIGNYYYASDGSPGYCGGDEDAADNAIRSEIVKNLAGVKVEAL